MMYAVLSEKTGVIRTITSSLVECMATRDFSESFGDPCIVVEIPQLMLDDFGLQLLAIHNEEVSEE